MYKKRPFGAAISTVFCAVVLAGCSTSAFAQSESKSMHRNHVTRAEIEAPDVSNSVEIHRDELSVDVDSVTSTRSSKSAKLVFNTARLKGWASGNNSNVVSIIDDEDYSGTPTSPSISHRQGTPTFNGYVVEMTNAETVSYTVKDGSKSVKVYTTVIPERVNYGTYLQIVVSKIVKNAFDFENVQDKDLKVNRIVIPKTLSEIEAGAFVNVPNSVEFFCEAETKPEGWQEGWTVVDDSRIHWGYELKTSAPEESTSKSYNEAKQRVQDTGAADMYYGKLSKALTPAGEPYFAILDDVNWSGDFENPYRSEALLSSGLNAYINLIQDIPASENVIIPAHLVYSENLTANIYRIGEKAISFDWSKDKAYAGNIKSITIPASVTEMPANAIHNVPEGVTIKCEAESKPIGWNDKWTDAKANQIQWGVAISEGDRTKAVDNINHEFRASNEAPTYILGYKYTRQNKYFCLDCGKYYDEHQLHDGKCPHNHKVEELKDVTPEYQLPLIVYYEVKNTQTGKVRKIWYELPLLSEEETSSSKDYYNTVKAEPFSRNFDVLVEENEELDADSIKVYNIFKAKVVNILTPSVEINEQGKYVRVDKVLPYLVPDLKVSFDSKSTKMFEKEVDISQVVKTKFDNVTKFSGYMNVTMNLDKVKPSYWYEGANPDIQKQYSAGIKNGTYSIRYAIYNLVNSYYRITYYSPKAGQEVTCVMPIKTPNSVVVLEKDVGNKVSFMVAEKDVYYTNEFNKKIYDFKIDNLKQFEIIGLTINIHLWENASSGKVGRTEVPVHFGALDIMEYSANGVRAFSIETFVWIFVGAFSAAFAAGAVALFFYLREKYKNDEFRRMKPKKYIINAVLGYLGSLVISLTIIFIVFRAGRFSNAIAVHNPIDVFVVIPGIISAVVIGYFIKFLVGKYKADKERRRALKLKLNEDKKDDGTN